MPLEEYDPIDPLPARPRRGSSDTWNSLKIGTEQLVSQVPTLLDIPSAAAFGTLPFTKITGAVGEATGIQPGRWAKENEETGYSPEYWRQQRAVGRVYDENVDSQNGLAREAMDIIKASPELLAAYAQNPGYTWNQVIQSLPSMLAGGGVARGLMGVGARTVAGETVGALERSALGTRWASPVAAGIGEGSVTAGQTLSQSIDLLGPDASPEAIKRAAAASLAAGTITGGIGVAGGRIAQRFGLETPETLIAGGRRLEGGPQLGLGRRVIGGALSEGVLQELPQSIQEGGWQNVAAGRAFADSGPDGQGLIRQGIEGMFAGGIMGGGANVFTGRRSIPTPADIPTRNAMTQGGTVDLLETPVVSPTQQPRLPFGNEGMGTAALGAGGVSRIDARTLGERSIESDINQVEPPLDASEIYRSVLQNPQMYTPEQVAIAQDALVKLGFQPRALPGIPQGSPQGELFPGAPRAALNPAGEGAQLGLPLGERSIEGNDVVTSSVRNPYLVGQQAASAGTVRDMFSGEQRPAVDRPLPRGVTSAFVAALQRGDMAQAEKIGAQAAHAGGELQRFYQLAGELVNPVDENAPAEIAGQRVLFHPNRDAILKDLHDIVQRGEQAMGQQELGTDVPSLPVREAPMSNAARQALFTKAMGGAENVKLLERIELAGRVAFEAASNKLDKLRKSKKATRSLIEETQARLAELEGQYVQALEKKQFGKLIALQKQVELMDAQTGEAVEGMSAELPVELPNKLPRQKELGEKATELWRGGFITDKQLEEVAAHLSGENPHYERAEAMIKTATDAKERAKGEGEAKFQLDLANIKEEATSAREKAAVKETVDLHLRTLMEAREADNSNSTEYVRYALAMIMNIGRYNYDVRDKFIEEDLKVGLIDERETANYAVSVVERLKEKGTITASDIIASQNMSHRMDEGAGKDVGGFTEAADREVKLFLAGIPKFDDRSTGQRTFFGDQDPMQILNKAALRLSREKGGQFEGRYEADYELKMNKESGKEERVPTRKAVDKLIKDILGEFKVYESYFGKMLDKEHIAQVEDMADRYGADVMDVVTRYMPYTDKNRRMLRHARVEFSHPSYWASGKAASERVSGKVPLSEEIKQRFDVVAGLILALDKETGNPKIDSRRESLKGKLLEIYNNTALRGTDKIKVPFPEFVMTLLTNPPGTKIYTGTSPEGKAANTAAMYLRGDLLSSKSDKTIAQWAQNVAALKTEQMAKAEAKAAAAERPAGTKAIVAKDEETQARAPSGEGQTFVRLPDGEIENYEVKGEVIEDKYGHLIITDLNVRNVDKGFDDPAFDELNDQPVAEVFKQLSRAGIEGADVDALKNQVSAILQKRAAAKPKEKPSTTVQYAAADTKAEAERVSLEKDTDKFIKNVLQLWQEGARIWDFTTPAETRVLNWLEGPKRSLTLQRARLAALDLGIKVDTKAPEIAIRQVLLKLEQLAAQKKEAAERADREELQQKEISKARQAERAADLKAFKPGAAEMRDTTGRIVPQRVADKALPEGGVPRPPNIAAAKETSRQARQEARAARPASETETVFEPGTKKRLYKIRTYLEKTRYAKGMKEAAAWLEGDPALHTIGRAFKIARGIGISPRETSASTAESVMDQIRAKMEILEREVKPAAPSRLQRKKARHRPTTKELIRQSIEDAKAMREKSAEDTLEEKGGRVPSSGTLSSHTRQQILARAREVFGDNTDYLKMVDWVTSGGRTVFGKHTVGGELHVSLEGDHPVGTFNHEAFHRAMRYHFTAHEGEVLRRRFLENSEMAQRVEKALTAAGRDYLVKGRRDYLYRKEDIGNEEIVAFAFQYWKDGVVEFDKPVETLFQRIDKFLTRVAYFILEAMSGRFKFPENVSAEDLFVRLDSGVFSGRAPAKQTTGRLLRTQESLAVPPGVGARALNFLPPAVRSVYAGPVAQVQAAFKGTVRVFAPIRDIAEMMVRDGMKTVDNFMRYFDRRMAMQRQKEQEAERIGQSFQRLRYNDQTKVSKFLGDSTLKGWGYQPTWLLDRDGTQIPVKINDAIKAQWDALANPDGTQSELQRIVDRVFQFGDDMWHLKDDLINQAIRDKYDAERTAAVGDQKKVQQANRDEREEMAKYGKHLPRMIEKPYAPLKRFGKFAVVGKSSAFKAVEDEYDSETVTPSRRAELETQLRTMKADPKHYEVRFEANAAAVANTLNDMLKRFDKAYSMERTLLAESQQYELPYHVLSRLKTEISELGLDPKVTNSLQRAASTLYIEMLSQENARKNELERLGVPGYGEMMHAFISQARSDASLVSTLTNNRDILQAMRAMRTEVHKGSTDAQRHNRSQLYNEMVRRYLNTTYYSDSTWQQKLMRVNSTMLLITSPAYLMQNASQVYMMALPKLAANYGWGRSAAFIYDIYGKLGLDAMKESVDFKKIGEVFNTDTARAIAELQNSGKIDITIMQEIGQWASNGIMPKSDFGRWLKENNITAATGRGLSFAASAPQRVEMMNRIVTGIASYQMKKEELDKRGKAAGVSDTDFEKANHDSAVAYAAKIIDESQGAYDEASAGRIFQSGNIPSLPVKLLLQFRKFQIIQLSFMIRDFVRMYAREKPANLTTVEWKEEKEVARRALGFAIAHYGVMTGAIGLPFVGMVAGALAALGLGGGDDDEPRPSLLAATPFATAEDRQLTDLWLRRQLGGGDLATLLTRGLPNALGIDLSAAIGAGTATQVFPYAKEGKTATERLQNQLLASFGATYGTGQRLTRAYDFMAAGDFYKGLEQGLPSGVGNALQGFREGMGEGKTDKSGTILTPAEDMSAWRSTLKGLGLKPTTDIEQNLLQQKVILTEQHYADLRKDIGQDYIAAKRDGDERAAADARQRWMRMATSMRAQGMKSPTLTELNNYWVREVRDQRQVIGGVVVKRADRGLAGGGI